MEYFVDVGKYNCSKHWYWFDSELFALKLFFSFDRQMPFKDLFREGTWFNRGIILMLWGRSTIKDVNDWDHGWLLRTDTDELQYVEWKLLYTKNSYRGLIIDFY